VTSPQTPMEYMQEVLIPEVAVRLIQGLIMEFQLKRHVKLWSKV